MRKREKRERGRQTDRQRERVKDRDRDVSFLSHICTAGFSSDEGVYVDTNGKLTKDARLQWGEAPTSVGKCHTSDISFSWF